MAKAGFLTPKAIGNRIKAKGLQKLRWCGLAVHLPCSHTPQAHTFAPPLTVYGCTYRTSACAQVLPDVREAMPRRGQPGRRPLILILRFFVAHHPSPHRMRGGPCAQNGFKCHMTSEAHQRQMLLVAEKPGQFVDKFSEEFKTAFLKQLKRTKGTKRVSAGTVYNEYIADKEHLHMNSTRWTSLTGFVQFLGQEGLCIVDETPKGWFIQYVDNDPEVGRGRAGRARRVSQRGLTGSVRPDAGPRGSH